MPLAGIAAPPGYVLPFDMPIGSAQLACASMHGTGKLGGTLLSSLNPFLSKMKMRFQAVYSGSCLASTFLKGDCYWSASSQREVFTNVGAVLKPSKWSPRCVK